MKQILLIIPFLFFPMRLLSQNVFTGIEYLLNGNQYQEAMDELQSRRVRRQCSDMPDKARRMMCLGETASGLCKYEEAVDWYRRARESYSTVTDSYKEQIICSSRIMELILHLDTYSYAEMQAEFTDIKELIFKLMSDLTVWYKGLPREEKEEEAEEFLENLNFGLISLYLLSGNYILSITGDYETALDFCRENGNIFKEKLPYSPETETLYRANLMLYGDASIKADRFEEALEYYNAVLEFDIRNGREKSVSTASVYRRLGNIYSGLNNAEDATRLYGKSESIFLELGRADHDEYAILLYDRGLFFKSQRDFGKASDDFSRALEIQKKVFGHKHISVFRTGLDLADCQYYLDSDYDIGQFDMMRKDKSFITRYFRDYRRYLELFGRECFNMRIYDFAIDLLNSVVKLNNLLPDGQTFHSRNAYYMLGESYLMLSDHLKALDAFKTMFDLERNFARDVFTFLPETGRASYWAACNEHMNGLFQLNRRKDSDDGISGLLYDAALFHKGLLLETTAGVAGIVSESGDPVLQKEFNHLQNLKQQQLGDDGSDPERTSFLKSESERIERSVMEGVRRYGDFMHFADIRWQDIRNALKEGEAAIEFISSRSTRHGTVYYSAEIIRYGCEAPVHVLLFALSPQEQGKWLDPGIYRNPVLGRRIWGKILPYLAPGDRIYFAAAGDFHNTAIEYLKIDDSTRINDIYALHRMSSTRQILSAAKKSDSRSAVLYGGLNYNTDPADMELYAVEFGTVRGLRRNKFTDSERHMPWGYLRGTRTEVDQIGQLLGENDFYVIKYTGDLGVEESFKALTKQDIRIMHLATHGFFISSSDNISAPVTEDQSLMQSALVLSGANNVWVGGNADGADDGILTAKEISLLDLRRADMVVLSACQTGLGHISGEGVFGLQRGFKKAGAGTLLMSLWEVDDRSTRLMMTEFYKALLAGKNKQDALHCAQEQVMQADFEVDGVLRRGSDPYFWASFILLD